MTAPSIKFMDLSQGVAETRGEIDEAIRRVLDSGWYLLGPELRAFESEYATFTESKHCVGVANGLDALRLALIALGVGPEDEVIVPSNTYIATWIAVSQVGAIPIPVEPDPDTCCLDPRRILAAITPRTKAIMPVHLYGQPADLTAILDLARPRGIPVVEDAAQCHGARHRGRRIGAHGDLVCWSFYPTKNLGALGDAGAITTDSPGLAERLRCLRNYGQRQRYVCDEIGWNSRLEELHAAVLRVRLRHLDRWNGRRSEIARRYLSGLAGVPGLRLPSGTDGEERIWHLFVVRHPRREALRTGLHELGIDTIVHYPIPPHAQQAYAGLGLNDELLPIAARLHREVLSLPCQPYLDDAEVERVCAAVRTVCGRLDAA